MSKRITIRWKQTCVTWAWATKRLSFLWKTSEEGVVLTFIGRERAWNRRISCRGRGSVSHVIAAWQLAKKEFTHGH